LSLLTNASSDWWIYPPIKYLLYPTNTFLYLYCCNYKKFLAFCNHSSSLSHVGTKSFKRMYMILLIYQLTFFLVFRNIIHRILIHQNYLVRNVQKIINLPFV
jgi:hypothetical protein